MLKLPKNIASHPNVKAIEALFGSNTRLLRPDGELRVAQWRFDEPLKLALKKVYAGKHLVQGLESISEHLDLELKGLKALKKLPGQTQNERLSRLVILSNDGSERFYHNAESIITRHAGRTLAVIVNASAEELGDAFTKKSNPAKALLIDERKALEAFLAALAEAR